MYIQAGVYHIRLLRNKQRETLDEYREIKSSQWASIMKPIGLITRITLREKAGTTRACVEPQRGLRCQA